jgi:acyl CoA:acetate/3-ketoacid CoA transferase alpha subunit/acyl CoA:acetate/3-ketoacid CoA transferase beta subunit
MDKQFEDVIESSFTLSADEGADKVVSLTEAIKENVKPGMSLFVDEGANAALREIMRQFHGTDPGFTLIMPVVTSDALGLIHYGIVKKAVTSTCLEMRPMPGPSRVIQDAHKHKRLEIENWSLTSLAQRLMAGALGIGFMPTKSIIGSSMATENSGSFREMEDPFGSRQRFGLVKALNPDLAIVHALAADRYGNTIMSHGDKTSYGAWGEKASKNGVVVTVEKLVSTDYIRKHATLVKLPGYMVKSVSVVPFGAHPEGLTNLRVEDLEAYGEDIEFLTQRRSATRDTQKYEAWLQEWVFDCRSQEEYLAKLGDDRLAQIKRKADADFWREELKPLLSRVSTGSEYNPTEMMIVASARRIRESVVKNGYKVLLGGTGVALLATWLGYFNLVHEGRDVELVIGPGFFGYRPRPLEPITSNYYLLPTCKIMTDVINAYGVMVGGENNCCMSILGAGEIDKYGNTNSTRSGAGVYLTGSGGANDAMNAQEVLLISAQAKERFLEKLPYLTCPGRKVRTLVSNLGIFERAEGGEFVLKECFPGESSLDDRVKSIKENCGWDLKVARHVAEVAPPTAEELTLLRVLDARGYCIKTR